MTPRRKSVGFRHIEFLRLADKRILLIIVTPEGDVQNRIIVTERAYSATELVEAANFLNQNFAGLNFDQIKQRLRDELRRLRDDMTQLLTRAVEAGSEAVDRAERRLCPIGRAQPAARSRPVVQHGEPAPAVRSVRAAHQACCSCSRSAAAPQGVQIYIGGESGLVPLDECSVVTAPYEVDGEVVGTVGVIGPTRMAYERVIPIVEITARLLSSALAQRAKAIE